MKIPSQGGIWHRPKTPVPYPSNALNLSTNLWTLCIDQTKAENTIFGSYSLLEATLGFGFSPPHGYNTKPQRRLSVRNSSLSGLTFIHFGGGDL